MSESSDEEIVVKVRANRTKRQRLLSENSNLGDEEHHGKPDNKDIVIDDSLDEILSVEPKKANGTSRRPFTIDDEDEEDIDDDDDDDHDLEDADREDDAIIEELYDDEYDDGGRRTSKNRKRVSSLRDTVVNFFQNASAVDLESIPGVSKKKVEQILTLRPISSWDDLNKKIRDHKSSAINEDVVVNAVKIIKSRTVVEKLMSDCMRLAQDIGELVDRLPEAQQPKCIPAEMKLAPYQLVGLNWLALMHNKGINAILADEMGLGKTVQVICFLAFLKERLKIHGHHLIIVPASTLDNWEREFDNWCPEIRLLQYYGTQDARAQIRYYVARNPDELDVVLTTYNVAQNPEDRKLFKKLSFEYLIFDEAHMLKNMKSSRYQSLVKIKSRKRILMTGTPLQNNLVELMSLLVFTMPRMFMPKITHVEALFSAASRDEGGKTQFEKERIEQAKKIMKPFVLRRLKDDVLKDLPKKTEETILVEMTKNQRKILEKLMGTMKREIKGHMIEVLDDDSSFATEQDSDIKKGAGMLMALRKVSNHPLLLQQLYTREKLQKMSQLMLKEPTHQDANPHLIFEDMCEMHDFELHKLCQNFKSIKEFQLPDEVIVDSGKFQFLDKLLQAISRNDEKCLLFSQFTMMLDIMEDYLRIRGYRYLRLDGQTKVSDRIDLIDHFNQNSDVLVFLLSTKAGGLGINLTAANIVVIHDIDFNPYNDKQAEDRSHRMGQEKDVKVYKLISKNTIEEGMLSIATEKLRLGRDMSEQDNDTQPATKDLRSLLRSTLKM